MAKAVCPKNPDHKRFITVVHGTEDWIVDEDGRFIEQYRGADSVGEVLHGPDSGNFWTCVDCGAEAEVEV